MKDLLVINSRDNYNLATSEFLFLSHHFHLAKLFYLHYASNPYLVVSLILEICMHEQVCI